MIVGAAVLAPGAHRAVVAAQPRAEAGAQAAAPVSTARSSSTGQPRIPPVAEATRTAEQRALAAEYGRRGVAGNDLRTLLVHPELVKGVMPFASYVTDGSTLSPRHRELLALRTAWLCRSPYLWATHARRATEAGVSAEELSRVARGPDAPGWVPFEASLLRAADELHRASFVSDSTWNALAAQYDTAHLMDAVFTVTELTMLAAVVNSAGVQVEPGATARMPADVPRPTLAARGHVPLSRPRVPPLESATLTPTLRAMLDPTGSGREVAAVYRTFAQHPALYAPRQVLSEYIRLRATLSPRIRELLILRIGYLCRSEYEWAAHAPAGRRAGLTDEEIARLADPVSSGWNAQDAALVRAVDELYADDRISDATWDTLAAQFDQKQLLDLLVTAGGYRMVSMALNTFGVPAEPGGVRFPPGR